MKKRQRRTTPGTTKARTRNTPRPSQTRERIRQTKPGEKLPAPTPIPATKRKLIADIPTREFLSFYKRFYKTLTGSTPFDDHHIHWEDGEAIDYRDPDDDDEPFSDPIIGDTHWNHEVNLLWTSRDPTRKNAEKCDALLSMIEHLPIIIQRWIDKHPIGYEERAQNLFDLTKLREADITLLKDNFPDFKSWHKDLYRLTGLDWELKCQIDLIRLINGDPDDPRQDKKALRPFKRILESRLKEIKRRLQPEDWPTGLQWIKEAKWLQAIFTRYKLLLPILRELYKARLNPDQCSDIHEKYKIPYHETTTKKGEKKKHLLLFIRTDYGKLAGQAKCSEISLTNYLRELTRTGLIQQHHKPGPKGWTIYSIGYYTRHKGYKARPFLTKKTADKLKGFNPNSEI